MDGHQYISDDEALARALQEEEEGGIERDDQKLAHQLLERSASQQNQLDMMVAVRQQQGERWRFQQVKREDTKFAKSLHNTELAARLQEEMSDAEIAKQLQEAEQEELQQKQMDCTDSSPADDGNPVTDQADGLMDGDSKYAAELHDREVAFQMQLELDKQLAESLANDDGGQNTKEETIRQPPHHPRDQGDVFDIVQPARQEDRIPNPGNRRPRQNPRPRNNPQRRAGRDTQPAQRDDVQVPDPDDYEANWELAERLGEVKDRSLDKELRQALPTSEYKGVSSAETEEEEERECKVCFCEFERGDMRTILPCLHKYHKQCIGKWFDTNSTCPICNLDVKDEMKKN